MAVFAREKQKFDILDVDGEEYLDWQGDVLLHLQSQCLEHTLTVTPEEEADKVEEANAMIFLRHHMSQTLKREFIQIKRLCLLWEKLKARFEHLRTSILPQVSYQWSQLRFMDFATVKEYKSALHRIESIMSVGGTPLSESEKLEKTFTTMHSSNMVLQQ